MQISRRHHFVPEFYLKPWLSCDQRGLWLYRRDFKNEIRADRRSTKSVGYVEDLYTLLPEFWGKEDIGSPPDAIETGFFAKLDADAAIVHQTLLAYGLNGLNEKEKYTWAKFLNSLMERGPARINEIETNYSVENIKNDLIQKFKNPEPITRILKDINVEAIYKNCIRSALISFINDEKFLRHVVDKMQWTIVYNVVEGEHFITSDVPLLINIDGYSRPIHCMSLALSPTRLMIIHAKSEEFDEDFLRTVAVLHNIRIIRTTEKYIFSSRKLDDGPHTKYSKALNEFLRKPKEDLRKFGAQSSGDNL